MNYKTAEVLLTVELRGKQATRGCYSYYHKIDKDGKHIHGSRTETTPKFTVCKKYLKLSNEFVLGALAAPPESRKRDFSVNSWKKLPEVKRISMHVSSYVEAQHPEHRGYSMEVL